MPPVGSVRGGIVIVSRSGSLIFDKAGPATPAGLSFCRRQDLDRIDEPQRSDQVVTAKARHEHQQRITKERVYTKNAGKDFNTERTT